MLVSNFATRLKKAMKIRNIKATEIVNQSEILYKNNQINKPLTKPLISHYLKGTYEAKQENIYTLASILNVDEAWLMGYDVPMDRKALNTLKEKNKYYPVPVYGQISAGEPNWTEECKEGYLPIDPELMGIINPDEHYFLRVKGESMNKVIKNGAFALIHKQDIVNNGEIAVVLVNGDNATLKRFYKQGDIIVLTPESTDETIKQQIYTKDTPIQVIGKYMGKMELNN